MERFAMLPAQENIERMLFQYEEKEVCNMGGFFSISSEEQLENSRRVMGWLPEAHGALRLILAEPGIMQLADFCELEIPVYESEETTQEAIYERIKKWVFTPFEQGKPLFALCLFHFGNGEWYGCEKFHHLIMDKKSLLLLIEWQQKMLKRLQQEDMQSVKESIALDCRYLQLMRKEQKKYASEEQARLWLKKNFSHARADWLDNQSSFSSVAESVEFPVSEKLFAQIHAFAKENQVSVESLWFLVFFTERFKRKGITYGVMGRMTEYRQRAQRDIVGLFSRSLPISFEVADRDIVSLCGQLESHFLTSLRYGEYSLSQLQQWEPDCNTNFDILVSYHPERMVMAQDQGYREIGLDYIDTPLRIWINDAKSRSSLQIFYQNTLYNSREMERLAQRYVWIMEQMVTGVQWEDITLLTKQDDQAYGLLNESTPTISPEKTIPQLFLHWACVNDDTKKNEIILKDASDQWTYQQALTNFFQVSAWLKEKGVRQGDIVGICMERLVWLPVVMLAVMDIGAAFLPIGYRESIERKKRLMQVCQFVVDNENLEKACRSHTVAYSWEELQKLAANRASRNIPSSVLKKKCAYLLYTSGSTGEPKAVQISQYSLMCRLQWMYAAYGNGEVTLQKTVNTFDVSVWELLLPLAYGGVLCLLPQGEEKYPDSLAYAVENWQICRMHFVPGMLEGFLYYLKQTGKKLPSLKEIFSSGEALKPEVAAEVFRLLPGVRLINLYGPTECTIDVSYHVCVPGEKEIPIGKAVANTKLYVLSPNKNVVQPIGVSGELCVVGDLVGMGYLSDSAGGYFQWEGKPAYRTGDFVSLSEQGELLYAGRGDRQRKLRGMRIDTGAAEQLLMENAEISSVYITVQKNCLVAYYEAPKALESPETLLLGKLPDYNIPERWFWLQEFPRKNNGKLDIKKLLQIRTVREKDTVPMTMTKQEQWLYEILEKYFPAENLQPQDNFMDAGLDSFTAMQIIQDIRTRGYDCSYSLIFRYPTIRLLAQELQREQVLQKGIDYLQAKQESGILLCIPFGGGESEIFGELAVELGTLPWDIGVVRMSYFEEKTVEEIAQELLPVLCAYERITLLGYCVGSALATELAKQLAEKKKVVSHVYLIASLPDTFLHVGKKKFSLWDLCSDTQVEKCLYRLNSRQLRQKKNQPHIFQGKIPQFRRDSTRFFTYMEQQGKQRAASIQTPVTMFFGGKDILTFHYKKRHKMWRRFYAGEISVRAFPEAGHYLLEECKEGIFAELKQTLQEFESGVRFPVS